MNEKEVNKIDIAVLSDIHSNHVALEACLEYIEKQNIQHLIFLGDYVSNCAFPERTMQLLYHLMNEKTCWFIKGNREELLINHANGADDGWVIPSTTSGAILYTYNRLSAEDITFFKGMSCSDVLEFQEFPRIAFCHGSMDSSVGGINEDNAEKYFREYQTELILCGHTHVAGIKEYPSGKVINAGSVGTPVNRTGEAEFVVLHGTAFGWKEELVTVPFNREIVIQELDESGLVEQSCMFGRMIRDLLLTNKDRWGELLTHAQRICEKETGDLKDVMDDKYLEKAAEIIGIH